MKTQGNRRGTQPKTAFLPPPQPGIPKAIQREVIRLAEFGVGCKLVARQVGISHTSVLRIWCRHGINRAKLQQRRQIVEEHQALALRIAKSVAHDLPLHMREDLSGVALAELVRLAGLYDPKTGVPFGAFSQQRIRGACLDSVRRRHYKNATAGELTTEAAEARIDSSPSPEAEVIERAEKSETRERLVSQLMRLPGRLAVITWLHYIESRPIEQIAVDIGVGASRVSQLHTEALGMMREAMAAK